MKGRQQSSGSQGLVPKKSQKVETKVVQVILLFLFNTSPLCAEIFIDFEFDFLYRGKSP